MWVLEYFPDVERWFDKLTEEQAKSVSKELLMLRQSGNELQLPHSKALGKRLFELRERRYGYRVYYTFSSREIIILLTAGNKATQKNDIQKARQRLGKLQ